MPNDLLELLRAKQQDDDEDTDAADEQDQASAPAPKALPSAQEVLASKAAPAAKDDSEDEAPAQSAAPESDKQTPIERLREKLYAKLSKSADEDDDQPSFEDRVQDKYKQYLALQPKVPSPDSINFSGDRAGSMENLKAAQELANKNLTDSNLLRAGNVLGAGFARTNQLNLSEPLNIDLGKQANEPVNVLNQKMQMEKFDPNSAYSKGMRDFLSQTFKIPVSDSTSASDLEKIQPVLGQLYQQQVNQQDKALQTAMGLASKEDINKENQENKLLSTATALEKADAMSGAKQANQQAQMEQKQAKRVSDLQKALTAEIASSRSSFGKAANVVRSAESLQQLVGTRDPNQLDSREIQELARSLDSILSNGQATVSGAKKLVPQSAVGNFNELVAFLTNKRQTAGLGDFVKQMLKTVQKEKDLANDQMQRTQKKILTGYPDVKKNSPEQYGQVLSQFGLSEEAPEDKEEAQAAPQQDPKIDAYGKANNLSYDQAEQILKARGYGK